MQSAFNRNSFARPQLVLSLFTIYQWNNGLCTATSGEYGMCLPESDCIGRRGILGGPCAQGYGICCVCKFILLKLYVC